MTEETLYTAEEAAAEVGLTRRAIYNWVARGVLQPVAKRGHLNLFRLADVFEAEKTRDHSRRRKVNNLLN